MHSCSLCWTSIAPVLVAVSVGSLPAKGASGPQVGEKIVPFTLRGVLDDEAGQNIDLVKDAAGRPLVIFFLHERTRQSVGLARQVLNEAASLKRNGLDAGLVLLTADVAAMQEWVKNVPQVLPRGVPIGISTDGPECPPAYSRPTNVAGTDTIVN